ncbi:efflux RND transporter periplasmic adaptor subunit [Akkermansiaceae bacterium]|nr:efflux RND transporter periplasmic adaptor subunit [Akkermansiaceae bacterium]MDB4520089.1 efflux RND transporter periplasmic adaptor subunit [Akkermansiaceae bacterium]
MKSVVAITLIVSLVIALMSGATISFLKKMAPEAEKKENVIIVPVVEVEVVQKGNVDLLLSSEGLVSPRRDTVLTTEVTGRIIFVDPRFKAGEEFKKGDVILELDEVNYRAAVAQAKATVADAELLVKQEEAQSNQAARDWKKIGNGQPASEMVRRVPFLASARARKVSAEAMLEKANKDLARTRIQAPFDCRVSEALFDIGATVLTGTRLGEVYDTSGFEVRLPFSLTDFSELPSDAKVQISATLGGTEYHWDAEIIRTEGAVDRTTLSAYVIAKIEPNPEAPKAFRTPLPGMFVRALVSGAQLKGVIPVSRNAVRGRDQVAVLNEKNELELRTLKIRRSSADFVYTTEGVEAGERVILTKQELPVVGMKLEAASTGESQPK